MLNITNNYRNANQNYNEIPSHTDQNGVYQKIIYNNKCWRGYEKREPSYTVGGNVENSVEAPLKKIKIELPYDLSNPILGHILGENHNSKRYIHASVYCSTIYNSQDMKAT